MGLNLTLSMSQSIPKVKPKHDKIIAICKWPSLAQLDKTLKAEILAIGVKNGRYKKSLNKEC